jgi:copper chaperone NosL
MSAAKIHPHPHDRAPRQPVASGQSPGGWQGLLTGRLSGPERGAVALAGVAVLLALVLPIWWVYLWAPQYPDGLTVLIHARDLTGDISNVNILNHYIGMKPLSVEMFPEFQWLTPVLASLGGAVLLVALLGRRELLMPVWLLLFAFDAYMLYDLSYWLYDWGHNLDPMAPMDVDPFMPPVLGFKRIANFIVYSVPSFGGALIMLASAIGPLLSWLRFRQSR